MVNKRGYSIPEVLMAGAVSVVLVATLIGITSVTKTTLAMGEAKIALQENGRRVMERLTRELRQTNEGCVHITQTTSLGSPSYGGSAIEFQVPLGFDSDNSIIWGATDENGDTKTNYKIQYYFIKTDLVTGEGELRRQLLNEFGKPVSGTETTVARNLRGGVASTGPNAANPLIFIGKYYYKGGNGYGFDNPNAIKVMMNFEKDSPVGGQGGTPEKISLLLVSEVFVRN